MNFSLKLIFTDKIKKNKIKISSLNDSKTLKKINTVKLIINAVTSWRNYNFYIKVISIVFLTFEKNFSFFNVLMNENVTINLMFKRIIN